MTAFMCVALKWRSVALGQIASKDLHETDRLKLAFTRQRQGRDEHADRLILEQYFHKLEQETFSDYHVS
jgi:hypothetical protein